MNRVLIATGNQHKVYEISKMFSDSETVKLFSPVDFGISLDVEEDGDSLEENAVLKAKAFYKLLGMPVISDDTGLFVDALGGAPGVFSARFAGPDATYNDNCSKLLLSLKDIPDSDMTAHFKSVICLLNSLHNYKIFEGICYGRIIRTPRGNNEFGYDPVFIPDGSDKTFAEFNEVEKNRISHRGLALEKLKDFLSSVK